MSSAQTENLIYMGILIVFMYFIFYLPQKKKDKQVSEMQKTLKVGVDVVTIGGIIGRVINVTEDKVTIETSAEQTKVDIYKWALKEIIEQQK